MGGGINLYNCMVVIFYVIGYMLVLFIEKEILEEERFGGWAE